MDVLSEVLKVIKLDGDTRSGSRRVALCTRRALPRLFGRASDVLPDALEIQIGARMLKSSSRSVAEIAAEVGYESEAAFNRAFKREFELPPARFRLNSRNTGATAAQTR